MKITTDMRICFKCRYDLKAERMVCRGCFKKFCLHCALISKDRVCQECAEAKTRTVPAA